MTAALPEIPHLLFSTRDPRPESSAGFNREVVAASPAVPEAVRSAFEGVADMTGFILRRPELPPVWAFRRAGADHWLVARAVSLGTYRKGHHQLLIHGLCLGREHLECLDGNPLLLASPEARAAGFRFEEEHPGDRRRLEPLHLDAGFAATAAASNLERLGGLSRELDAGLDPGASGFPALYDRLVDRARPTAFATGERPDLRLLEWLLLHLHAADRAELSFHSWYAYDSPRPFDLVGAAASDLPELRRQLRDLDAWDADAPPSPASPSLGEQVQALRRRDPHRYALTVDAYYLTLLAGGAGPDLRGRTLPPLSPDDAALCLRGELGEPLSAEEEERRRWLATRRGGELSHQAVDLAEAWQRGAGDFAARLGRLRETPLEVDEPDRALAAVQARGEVQRWALLALLPAVEPPPDAAELRRLWPHLVPAGGFDALLALFREPAQAALAAELLPPWLEALAAAPERPAAAPPPWARFLRFLRQAGLPVAPAAERFEQVLDAAPPAARLAGYRELQKACADAGLAARSLRVLFRKELPALDGDAYRIRAGDGVRRLLESDGGGDELAAGLLAGTAGAAALFEVLTGWLLDAGQADPRRWRRCRRLLEAARGAVAPAAVPAAADFLAAVAASPLAERVAEGLEALARQDAEGRDALLAATARRLLARLEPGPGDAPAARGAAALVRFRLEVRAAGEEADRALLALLLAALVCLPPRGDGARLRTFAADLLDHLADAGRFPALAEPATAWRHLLLDEMLLAPAGAAGAAGADDPRYRAYQLVAWRAWAEAGGADRAAEMAVLRLIDDDHRAGQAWHRRLLDAAVPGAMRPRAAALLDTWLPPPAADRFREAPWS